MEQVLVDNCLVEEGFTQHEVQRTALWQRYRNWFVQMAKLFVLSEVVNYK